MTYNELYLNFIKKYNKDENPNINNDFFNLIFRYSYDVKNIADFYINRNKKINLKINIDDFISYIRKIGKYKVPLSLLVNNKTFYGNNFYLRHGVLIPRSETELLVDKIVFENFEPPYKILDLCSGIGNIGLSLSKALNSNVTLVEKYYLPFLCSLKNRRLLKISPNKVKFKHMDIHTFLNKTKQKFDIVVMNPPYIDFNDKKVEKNVLKYEPHNALYAKNKGLYFYQLTLNYIPYLMKNRIIIYFEIGYNQKNDLIKIIKNIWWFHIFKVNYIFSTDYNNLTRFLKIEVEEK